MSLDGFYHEHLQENMVFPCFPHQINLCVFSCKKLPWNQWWSMGFQPGHRNSSDATQYGRRGWGRGRGGRWSWGSRSWWGRSEIEVLGVFGRWSVLMCFMMFSFSFAKVPDFDIWRSFHPNDWRSTKMGENHHEPSKMWICWGCKPSSSSSRHSLLENPPILVTFFPARKNLHFACWKPPFRHVTWCTRRWSCHPLRRSNLVPSSSRELSSWRRLMRWISLDPSLVDLVL